VVAFGAAREELRRERGEPYAEAGDGAAWLPLR
jgi:hypothetical protein